MTLERDERFTYVEAIAELRRRLAEPGDEESAAADLAGLIAVEQALEEFDAGVHPFGLQTLFEGMWEFMFDVGSGAELLGLLIPDPRHRARPDPPMSLETADAIVAGFQLGLVSGSGFEDVFGALSDADRDDLSHTARRLHELRHAPVADGQSVGVLMPLRLETRFFEPEQPGTAWRLRLRVFPEEASFDRDPGPPTTDEAEHTAVMWQRCDGDLTTAVGRAAFGDLAAKVGGPRAAWLARTLPADGGGIGADRPRMFSRPRGLPPALMVFLARGGGEPKLAEVLSLDRETIAEHMDLNALYEQVGDPDDPPPDTWWTSFSDAKFVGLAADLDIGQSPDDIDAVYVIGLGDEEPGALLRAHAANGRLAVVAPGTPTNSVAGDPAADLGRDPDGWWRLATSSGFEQPAVRELDLALCGGAHLGPLAGGELDLQPAREALSSALFPVVAGRMLKDQWNLGLEVWDVGRWTRRCLAPEGPFPTIRVADQPYGVLPVTAILPEPATGRLRWVSHPADPPIEGGALVPALSALLPAWAAATEADGNVIDADTERLLDLIGRTPVTASWARRIVVAVDILRALGFAFAAGELVDELERAWANEVNGINPPVLPVPARRLIPFGDAAWLPEDLTAGTSVPTIRRLLDSPNGRLVNVADSDWAVDDVPAPLLARLVRHALVLTNAELSRLLSGEAWAPWEPAFMPPIAQPEWLAELARQDFRDRRVHQDQRRIDDDGGPDIMLPPSPQPEGIVEIARGWEAVRDGAEALASGELDEAALDRGLRSLLDATSHRLDPWLTGVAARRLRWLQSRGVPWRLGAYGWVDSPRPGQREELRPGPTVAGLLHAPSHTQALTAALLRDHAVREQDVGRWNLTLDSDRVRNANRLAGQVRAGVHVKEALGRLVEELVGDPGVVAELRRRPEFRMRPEHEGRRVCDGEAVVRAAVENPALLPAGVPVAEVAKLQDVLDTYGDLLVADGLFDVVSGRPDRAAEAMEAAAGLGPPSDLRVLRTPREGRALSTAVLAVLPADPPLNGAAPGALADPIFAALLEHETGDPAGVEWRWTVGAATVSLAQLGLAPVDVLTVPAGALAARVRGEAGAADDAPIADPPALRTAHELAELLAGQDAPPATVLGLDVDEGGAIALEAIALDLRARIAGLRTAAGALAGLLETAPTATALAEAERWGVQANDGTLAERAAAAAAVIRKRLSTDDEAAGGGPSGLLARVRAVAGAAGLPVVCRVARSALDTAPADGGRLRAGHAAGLDEEWLDVTAAVRPPLARLEAWQLTRAPGRWHAWSTHAGDPWRADWLAANAARRDAAPSEQVIAYGPEAALDKEHVGVLLLDRFAETVPSSTHATSAAFGFNGPKSRAPQAILLAVPPDPATPLDAAGIVPILAETRLLARARMATPDALARYRIPLPTTLLLGWGAGERFANVDLEQVKPR